VGRLAGLARHLRMTPDASRICAADPARHLRVSSDRHLPRL